MNFEIFRVLKYNKKTLIRTIKENFLNNFINIFFSKNLTRNYFCLFLLSFGSIMAQEKIFLKQNLNKVRLQNNSKNNTYYYANNTDWEKINSEKKYKTNIIWRKVNKDDALFERKKLLKNDNKMTKEKFNIGSFNRSIIFDDSIVGPDISWLVPPGIKWNRKYKFDTSVKGHSGRFDRGRKKGTSFWGWNNGDAVGQFYYQFLENEKTSFGLNYGIRSVYSGDPNVGGGTTAIGEGQSLGFRIDRKISSTEGFAFGAEQLLHFDGLTDTGRNIYLTFSKALWSNNKSGQFPIDIYTFGIASGRMAEGNIKFLCSNLFGGSGTEVNHQRSLCWAPVFSVSRVYNRRISTFFEYNSKWFLLGSSIAPFNDIPLRGTFAVQLSDHIDNYKLNNFDEMKWVFRLSLGF